MRIYPDFSLTRIYHALQTNKTYSPQLQKLNQDVFIKSNPAFTGNTSATTRTVRITPENFQEKESEIIRKTFNEYTREDLPAKAAMYTTTKVRSEDLEETLINYNLGRYDEAKIGLEAALRNIETTKKIRDNSDDSALDAIGKIADKIVETSDENEIAELENNANEKLQNMEARVTNSEKYLLLKGILEEKLGTCYKVISYAQPDQVETGIENGDPVYGPNQEKIKDIVEAREHYANAKKLLTNLSEYYKHYKQKNVLTQVTEIKAIYGLVDSRVEIARIMPNLGVSAYHKVTESLQAQGSKLQDKLAKQGFKAIDFDDTYKAAREDIKISDEEKLISNKILKQLLASGGAKSAIDDINYPGLEEDAKEFLFSSSQKK